ncbi:MAG: YicC family protein [Spirochaetaceae bacterium]|jgi:uncharacterized protein (TIGR00255 family)|nr:YicC family protein [Spirochaetaceae bacterium]
MKSMTGFAYAEKQSGGNSVSVEIKSYNSRFLELEIHLVPPLSPLEPRIRGIIAERCKRGKIEVTIHGKKENPSFSVSVNAEAVRAYAAAAQKIKSLLPPEYGREKIPLGKFLELDGVIEIIEAEKEHGDENEAWEGIKDVFIKAFEKFENERRREGQNTKENILSHIAILEKSHEGIAALLPRMEQSIKNGVKSRIAEFAGESIDENRILAETALLLMKYTIAEEVSRLSSHLSGFRESMAGNDCSGKKLDFICQEINREINTIGAKTPLIEVSRIVIDMKDAVENIREQLRNVE